MNCHHITGKLAEGAALEAPEMEHVAGCEACQELTSAIEAPNLDAEFLRKLRAEIGADIVPVSPLPSDGALIGRLVAAAVAFIVLVAFAVRMLGIDALSPLQMLVYFGVILSSVAAGAAVITGEMIPGSRLRSRGTLWAIATSAGLVLVSVALFRNYDLGRFVRLGMPCLEIGSVAAMTAGLLLSLHVRRGFLGFPRAAARRIGFFAAVSGVAVLALHCPYLNVSHILVWHFGVLLLGWLAGDLAGRFLEER